MVAHPYLARAVARKIHTWYVEYIVLDILPVYIGAYVSYSRLYVLYTCWYVLYACWSVLPDALVLVCSVLLFA